MVRYSQIRPGISCNSKEILPSSVATEVSPKNRVTINSETFGSALNFISQYAGLFVCSTQMKPTFIIYTKERHNGDSHSRPSDCGHTEPGGQLHLVLDPLPPSCRTSDVTVDSLAPELLKMIFEMACADNATEALPMSKSTLGTANKLSHVCRLWRDIALDTPSLWTTIDRFHDKIDNFVSRSKSLPVYLNLEAEGENALAEINFPVWLQRYSDRLHGIFAEGSSETVQNLLQSVGMSLPKLVSLDLRVLSEEFVLLPTSTPNLRRLFLYHVSVNLDAYANLTHLTLEGLYSGTPKAADVVHLLRKCPRLSVLCLYGLELEVVDSGVGEWDGVVELAQLQTLEFQQLAMDTTAYLLSRIKVPLCAPLVHHCHNYPSSDQELWLEIVADRYIVLGASTQSPNGICTFRVDLPYNSRRAFSDIKIVMSAVDTSTVVSLLFVAPSELYAPPSVDAWLALLARLPSLIVITLSMPRQWIETFVKALCSHEPVVLCPSLEILTIMDIDVYDLAACADLGQIIWDYLHARVQSDVRLLELLRLHCGHGDCLNWERVTKTFESCVSCCLLYLNSCEVCSLSFRTRLWR
jgi:hypothetical protein